MQFRKHTVVAVLAATTALGACASPERFETSTPGSNANSGALMGSIVGAMIGLAGGDNAADRRSDAVKGAIFGAAAGGLIGNQLDQQAAAIEAGMGNSSVTIENTGESLIVTLPQDILFATDSTAVREDLRSDLLALSFNLQDYPNSTVQIVGHTDNVGSAAYNENLSLRRASAVANVMIDQGVLASRISTLGLGESRPIDTNLTEIGRAQNRRVEIVILPY
ncbi:MAG: OmpA family protein [Paracoccaceae bacterium]|jgi:outer membrane protein OmpA-like peptidoglycan-associated protein|nr:OmpA family protein [Paracoccaceae bacterium]